MATIALDRRFFEWEENERPDPEIRSAMGLGDGAIGWDELLAKRHVIILAEAGSGKSTELAERARQTTASGRIAFHARVDEVGRDGLEAALSLKAREKLKSWRASKEDAWFFIDSVDEAKAAGIRLEKALSNLADGIYGADNRAHVILSGRTTDWEFRKDLESLRLKLPTPAVIDPITPTTQQDELLRIVRREPKPEKECQKAEQFFVAVMAPLDRERVRTFAKGKGAPNVDDFLGAIDTANFGHFAQRPLDLDWLVSFWQSKGRLGSLSEIIERSVTERLKEKNPNRSRLDKLDGERALRAAERIGAAMVFCKRSTIAIPDSEIAFSSDSPLDLADVLSDWSVDDRTLLLSRPIFDPATLGRIRFHNDNTGVVRGYLAAQWLVRLRGADLSTGALFHLLFATSYGLEVLKPSLNETAAWLALWDQDVAREVIQRSPLLLMMAGDPASLRPDNRRDTLVQLLKELTASSQDLPWLNNEQLSRFARPDLGAVIQSLWPHYRENTEAAQLLLRLVWLGGLKDCADLAERAAYDSGLDSTTRIFASRAFLGTCDELSKKKYAALVVRDCSLLPVKLVRDAVDELFPSLLSVADLLAIVKSVDVAKDHGGLGFAWDGPRWVQKLDSAVHLKQLLTGLFEQLGGELGEHAHYPQTEREEAYFPAISEAAARLLKRLPPETVPTVAIDAVLRIGNRVERGREVRASLSAAQAQLHKTVSRRRAAFWRVAERLRRPAEKGRNIEYPYQMQTLGYHPGLRVEDVNWLLEDGLSKGPYECRLAINSALSIQQSMASPGGLLESIRLAVNDNAVARDAYEQWTRPVRPNTETLKQARELKQLEQENADQKAKDGQSWIDLIAGLRKDPERIANLRIASGEKVNKDLFDLWQLLDRANGRSRYAIDNVAALEKTAGMDVAEAAREGLIAHWRNSVPLLRSQKEPKDWNSVRWVDLLGIVGVTLGACPSILQLHGSKRNKAGT